MSSRRKTHVVITCFTIVMSLFMGLLLGMIAYVFRSSGQSWEFIAVTLGVILAGGVGMVLLMFRNLRRQRVRDEHQKRVSKDPRLKEMVTMNPRERKHAQKVLMFICFLFVLVLGGLGTKTIYDYVHYKDADVVMAEVKEIRRSGSNKHRKYRATIEVVYDGATITETITLARSGMSVAGVSVSASKVTVGDEIEVLVVATDTGYDVGVASDVLSPWGEIFFILAWCVPLSFVIHAQVKTLKSGQIRLGALPEKYRLARSVKTK